MINVSHLKVNHRGGRDILPEILAEVFPLSVSAPPPQACRDFLALAQGHSKRWQKALQAERDQRVRLEETLEQLAKQHNHLERAFRGATVLPPSLSNPAIDSKGKALADYFNLTSEPLPRTILEEQQE